MSGITDRSLSGDIARDDSGPFRYAFRHQVPDEFVRLPEPTESDGWREAMARLMPESAPEQQDAVSEGLRQQLPHLGRQENVILTAMCAGTEDVDGEERLSMGLLAITVRPSGHGPSQRLLTAEAIYRATERKFFTDVPADRLQELNFSRGKGIQGPQDMLLATKIPCGPAVMSTSLRSLKLPAMDAGISVPPLAVASLQLIVPAPYGYCVYVTISTPSVFLVDSYSARLSHIARTLAFDAALDLPRPVATE